METHEKERPETGETAKLPKKGGRSTERWAAVVFLGLLAVGLSAASMVWAVVSVQDMLKDEGLGNASLSIALTMDATWAATMIYQHCGGKAMLRPPFMKKERDFLPVIGWLQLGAVMSILGWHGQQLGNVMALFGAALPLAAKLAWHFVLNLLRDPTAPTPEDEGRIAAKRRTANVTLAEMKAEEELKRAELEREHKEHEARMARLRAEEEERREAARLRAETERMELENDKRLELERERFENTLKLEREQMAARLQIETLRARQGVDREMLDAQRELDLRSLGGSIQGQVLRSSTVRPSRQISPAHPEDGGAPKLSESEERQMLLAREYYAVRHANGGNVTKTAFCKANGRHLSRVSEATTRFPENWFVERGLADWLADAE